MNREDFPMLRQDIIYFDNGATTLKPQCVIDKVVEYYSEYCANAHRGDYKTSIKVDLEYENARNTVQDFINAKYREEIIFTSGSTQGLNMIANGFFGKYLEAGDEILITKSEHASNVLPWFNLEKELGVKVFKISALKETGIDELIAEIDRKPEINNVKTFDDNIEKKRRKNSKRYKLKA